MPNGIVTGLGGRGLHWIGQVRAREDCRILGYVEPSEANRRRAVEQHHVPEDRIYASLDDALDALQADFILDVTPPAAHAAIARKAFGAGLHLLQEKPLSDSFDTAQQVVAAGDQAGVKHMITQNYRFTECPRTARQYLADGLVGRPGQCDVRFYKAWADLPGTHYVSEPFMLINDMMVHHFDLLRYVLGQDPVSVQAITWNHPWGWHEGDAAHAIVFQFPGGLVATHVACGCALGSDTTYNGDWRIEGTEGSLDWIGDRLWHCRMHRCETPGRREVPPLALPRPEQAILDEFFSAIEEDREPECSARDNLKSLAMVFGAIRSAREHRKVELAELM